MTTATQNLTNPPVDCREMGLTPGTRYDRSQLRFACWINEGGEIESGDVDGYCDDHYWDADGRYLGPDSYGIVPAYDHVVNSPRPAGTFRSDGLDSVPPVFDPSPPSLKPAVRQDGERRKD